jgi:hypothetical protein
MFIYICWFYLHIRSALIHDHGLFKTVFHSITFLYVPSSMDLNLTMENIHNFVGNLKRSTMKYVMLRNWLNVFKYDEAISDRMTKTDSEG